MLKKEKIHNIASDLMQMATQKQATHISDIRGLGRELFERAMKEGLPRIDVRVIEEIKQGRLIIQDVEGTVEGQPMIWTRISNRNSANVLPILKEGESESYILTWKPQLSVESWTFEIIGGYTKVGETQAETAIREVREEAGFEVGKLSIIDSRIGNFPGRISWVDISYAAEDLTFKGKTSTEIEERPMKIIALTPREVIDILQNDLVISATSKATLWKYIVNRYLINTKEFENIVRS